jgi:uncharacterized short protein YbdD (DUF466 family)
MICRCFGKTLDLSAVGAGARQTALLMLGVPDYEAYVAHLKAAHPDQIPPDRDAFIAARQQARYARGGLRCC